MTVKTDAQLVSKAMAILGAKGGKKASKKKSDAARRSLEKARAKRWKKSRKKA